MSWTGNCQKDVGTLKISNRYIMTYNYQPPTSGEAFIAIRKNRIKTYAGNKVYLQDKQEFEIELFNPSATTKLAKISINGKEISSTGLVLKPGQRVYLERYIDNPRKFLFETYSVEGDNSAVQKAIQQNGDIQISFYDEQEPYKPPVDYWIYNSSLNKYNNRRSPTVIDLNNQFYTTNAGNGTLTLTSTNLDNRSINCFSSGSVDMLSAGATTEAQQYKSNLLRSASKPVLKETGRVEKGSHSSQNFKDYDGEFRSWATNTVSIKLLPLSEKPLEISDLVVYCGGCGSKKKKNSHKFCSNCGTEF